MENVVALLVVWSMLGVMGGVVAGLEAAHGPYPPKKIPLWKECLYVFLMGPVCWVIGGIVYLIDHYKK